MKFKWASQTEAEMKWLDSSFLLSRPTWFQWILFCVPVNSAHSRMCKRTQCNAHIKRQFSRKYVFLMSCSSIIKRSHFFSFIDFINGQITNFRRLIVDSLFEWDLVRRCSITIVTTSPFRCVRNKNLNRNNSSWTDSETMRSPSSDLVRFSWQH